MSLHVHEFLVVDWLIDALRRFQLYLSHIKVKTRIIRIFPGFNL